MSRRCRGAVAAQPARDVLDADVDVVAQAGLAGRRERRPRVEQVAGGDVDVVALLVDLVGALAEHRVELRHRGLDESGCATQEPSKPSPASRPLSSATFFMAASFCVSSLREGRNADMPPMACAPRLWQVLTSSSV
jgi:hypothetical protein